MHFIDDKLNTYVDNGENNGNTNNATTTPYVCMYVLIVDIKYFMNKEKVCA